MNKSNITKFLAAPLIVGIIGFTIYQISNGSNKDFKSNTTIGKVEKIALIQRVTIAGNVTPARKTIVTAPFNGYVKKIFVKIGQKVKKGEPIVTIVQSLQSTDPLFPLRSPFDGIVVSVNKQEGEFVMKDDPKDFILRIDGLDELYVNSNVPEIDMVKIKLGQEAIIKASAILDRKYKGTIVSISLASKNQDEWGGNSKVEYPTKIRILDFDKSIKPGMSVILDIVTFKKEGILGLRHEFILKENGQYYVYSSNDKKIPIKVGIQNETYFEILEGLKERQEVKQIDFIELLRNENK